MSEPLGHEPEETHDHEYAPVLRDDEESRSREEARTEGRKVTGTGVPTRFAADGGDEDGTETRSELEEPDSGADKGP